MIELPTERRKPQNYNPKLLIINGKPKSGKSSLMAAIDDNLIIDLEDGYRSLEVMSVYTKNAKEVFEVERALKAKMDENGKKPYKFITIDNATRLEEFSLEYAAALYRGTNMGRSWGVKKDKNNIPIVDKDGKYIPDPKADIRTLPNGGGYLWTRKAVRKMVEMFNPYCETLILITHVKDKQINVNGTETSVMEVDLSGKVGDIICGEADAIGYLYRSGNKTLLSFKGGDNSVREARPLHLRGKEFCVIESDDNNNLTFHLDEIFV